MSDAKENKENSLTIPGTDDEKKPIKDPHLGVSQIARNRKTKSEADIEKDRKRRGCMHKYCGLETKKNITPLNIISLFLIFLMGGLSGNGTVLNTVYSLGAAESKDDSSVEAAVDNAYKMSNIELYYIIAGMISAPVFGYLYEMTTRKFVLACSLIALAVCLGITFFVDSDKKPGLSTAASVLTSTFMYALMGNPLIMDYIKKYSRGRASALQEMGRLIGELIGFFVIFGIYRSGGDVGGAFLVISIIVFCVGVFVSCLLVKEKKISVVYIIDPMGIHKIVKEDIWEDEDEEDDGLDLDDLKIKADRALEASLKGCKKVKTLTTNVFEALGEDRILWFAIYASFVHKFIAYSFNTYFWLYVTSWVGQLDDFTDEDALDLYALALQVGMTTALVAMPFFGWYNDKRPVNEQLLIAYGIRMIASFFFFFARSPKDLQVWLCAIGMIVGSNLESIASYGFWVKRIPKDVRALMNGYFGAIARTG